MPELPEIETVKKGMQVNIGAKITNIEIYREDIIKAKDFDSSELYGQTISNIRRRGKFLIFNLEKDYNVIFHLGMSGRFYMIDASEEISEKHVHIVIHLDNQKKLLYQDTRRFGGVWLVKDLFAFFTKMGVEPLTKDFNADYLYKITRKRKIAIKSLILNQHLIAGIGNIYADESLFMAGIRPDKKAGLLTFDEADKLCKAIKQVLKNAIKERGTTFSDFRDSYNQLGNYQNFLQIYGRTNEKCFNCDTLLERQKIGGRSSHYCPKCQQ
ncbi:MAG TPA: bifunctional DNA-formamidopyrimidine glycosylase/DNA-(apurinic or apyrimidinic site) lyase [Syntrophomonadaceae bacterium]|nr:bifunctional DNA-formamidopyrimidine glycosylase/DNA-(apurinic or apyrimidinic site) lyase [Syntrophomonadaceae bacterium]